MGFKEDKARILQALSAGRVLHDHQRTALPEKNWVDSGKVSLEIAREMISLVRGPQAEHSPHHLDSSVKVWIFKPTFQGTAWYIKCYLDDDDLWLLSFHPSEVSS